MGIFIHWGLDSVLGWELLSHPNDAEHHEGFTQWPSATVNRILVLRSEAGAHIKKIITDPKTKTDLYLHVLRANNR